MAEESKELEIPVSLGKPSLRRRLEAYYSLINPESIQDQVKWRNTFQQIYAKYGGTYEGERKLASKLAKKYGSTVRLLLAESVIEKNKKKKSSQEPPPRPENLRDESWFALRPEEKGSGVLDFTSKKFDPQAALRAPQDQVLQENSFIQGCPVLNIVDQFKSKLPPNDPLFRPAIQRINNQSQKKKDPPKQKKLGPFAAIAEHHKKGPLSFLHQLFEKRQRVRVLIRYVDSIRGTLTGYLVAYDKHCNLILRDVDEVYSPRRQWTENQDASTNLQAEMDRRIGALQQTSSRSNKPSSDGWQIRQRHMKQLMVRGDNVVMIYKAESERSSWPQTSKSPAKSVHGRKAVVVPEEQRVGSPSSLIYSLQAAKQAARKRQRSQDHSSSSNQRYDYQSSYK